MAEVIHASRSKVDELGQALAAEVRRAIEVENQIERAADDEYFRALAAEDELAKRLDAAEIVAAGMVKKSGDTMTGRLRFAPMTGDEGVVEVRTDSTETVTVRDIYEYVRLIALKSVADQHNVADVDVRYQKNGDIALYNQLTRKVNGNSLFATLALSISNGGFRSLIASGLDAVSLPSGDAVKFNGKSLTEIIASIKTLTVKVVDTLPATGEDRTIYLVPNGGTGTNVKDEYLWVDGRWEKIGTTDVDLSEYFKKADVVAPSSTAVTGQAADAKLTGDALSVAQNKADQAQATADAANTTLATKITNYGMSSDEIRFVDGPDGGNVVFYLRNGSIDHVIFSSIGDGKSIIFEWIEDGETKHMYVEDIATKSELEGKLDEYALKSDLDAIRYPIVSVTNGQLVDRSVNVLTVSNNQTINAPSKTVKSGITYARDFVVRIDVGSTAPSGYSWGFTPEVRSGDSWDTLGLLEANRKYIYRFTDVGGSALMAAREEVA